MSYVALFVCGIILLCSIVDAGDNAAERRNRKRDGKQ